MARESAQHKLDRVRSPRRSVHITYVREGGDGVERRELPFVVGVLGNFSGQADPPLPGFTDRRFHNIDRDNFDRVFIGMRPRLTFRVENHLICDGSEIDVELWFTQLQEFEPDNLVQLVEPLRRLVEVRARLALLLPQLPTTRHI